MTVWEKESMAVHTWADIICVYIKVSDLVKYGISRVSYMCFTKKRDKKIKEFLIWMPLWTFEAFAAFKITIVSVQHH